MRTPVTPIVALDVPDEGAARALVRELGELCRFYKVGSELFSAAGPAIVKLVRDGGADVFLDLKYHDIPNTVHGAARSAAALGVRLLTVHAVGGQAMIEAAVAGARAGHPGCHVLAVTVLTSMDEETLGGVWGRPVPSVEAEVLRLAGVASAAGAHGIVCSGREAGLVHARFGDRLSLLVPGVRFAGGATQDQSRVVTPRQAADAGARYVVLGRAVTAAESPRNAMSAALADLS